MKIDVNSSLNYCKEKTTIDKNKSRQYYFTLCPEKCDLCSNKINDFSYFADAIIPGCGQRGSLCQLCIEGWEVEFGPELGNLSQKVEIDSEKTIWRTAAGYIDTDDDVQEEENSEHDIDEERASENSRNQPYETDYRIALCSTISSMKTTIEVFLSRLNTAHSWK